jgi:hypothetical protein
MSNKSLQNNIQNTLQDPITKILLKYSNLTVAQLETFVIDVLTELLNDKKISYNEKTRFRDKKVSRGSFSRTLSQSRRNIISSIFTIILVYYIGIFETSPLEEYEMLADQLKEYAKLIDESNLINSQTILETIEKELMEGIFELTQPKKMKIT